MKDQCDILINVLCLQHKFYYQVCHVLQTYRRKILLAMHKRYTKKIHEKFI